ncbi:LysR family transcriptional regulator [Aliikangiella coralliicola]|uniref:LysR family transcriptional regulator n=1 Tax=Aliikangiella coralliicola TaxID=2592383 RepID=A0A545TV39_9GAMM|nr:LysR family transcriptional regulator [Aliikangiella coralliicola]TQV81082.1 LysR family transcriptional regulator [Aliikangiella coralliicola]
MINWNDLKYFLVLSREGTVSAAGRVLGVKHMTVARRIQALEQSLGTRLFDRTRNGYSMTQAAENLLDLVTSMEEKVGSIDRQAANLDSALAGPLKLTVAFELANRLIIPDIGEFCHRFPNIDMQLLMTKDLVDLVAMEADLAIRMTPNPPEYLVGREIMKLRHGIYASQSMLENISKNVKVILFQSEVSSPQWVKEHFKNAKVSVRVDDVGSMAVAAASGLGLAKLPCFIGDTQPGLFRLDRDIGTSNWGVWVLNHVDLRATARVRACKEYLMGLLESKRSLIQGENSRYA